MITCWVLFDGWLSGWLVIGLCYLIHGLFLPRLNYFCLSRANNRPQSVYWQYLHFNKQRSQRRADNNRISFTSTPTLPQVTGIHNNRGIYRWIRKYYRVFVILRSPATCCWFNIKHEHRGTEEPGAKGLKGWSRPDEPINQSVNEGRRRLQINRAIINNWF